jgi:hypothetical protein
MSRPIVLFHCDVEGWAYWNRTLRLSRALKDRYDIRATMGERVPPGLQGAVIDRADILMAQGVKVIDRMVSAKRFQVDGADNLGKGLRRRYDNVVARLDSMRVDHNGEYVDIWTL